MCTSSTAHQQLAYKVYKSHLSKCKPVTSLSLKSGFNEQVPGRGTKGFKQHVSSDCSQSDSTGRKNSQYSSASLIYCAITRFTFCLITLNPVGITTSCHLILRWLNYDYITLQYIQKWNKLKKRVTLNAHYFFPPMLIFMFCSIIFFSNIVNSLMCH